ncbi:MAG: hypothetical protein HKN11_18215 [Rhizobiales bacterium]|nr:hypothetical protein [Hyphomicrobiales bacterium]
METLNWGIWGLITAYVAVALVLLSLHIYSNWNFSIKAMATVIVMSLCAVTYKSYPGLLGWPVPSSSLPSRLYLVAIEVQEPDNVFLWAKNLDQGLGDRRPRAYQISYSKSLHEQAEQAGRKMRRGISMIAETVSDGGLVTLATGEVTTNSQTSQISFVEAPQGLLPDKE